MPPRERNRMACPCPRCNGALVSKSSFYLHRRLVELQPAVPQLAQPNHLLPEPTQLNEDNGQLNEDNGQPNNDSSPVLDPTEYMASDPLGLYESIEAGWLNGPEEHHADEDIVGNSDADLFDSENEGGVSGDEGEERTTRPPSAAEITLLFIDWMCTNKVTDAAAQDMWSLLHLILPPVSRIMLKTWWQLKRSLKDFEPEISERVDVCVNDCIAYWNSKHMAPPYRHKHRTRCPKCNEPRYVVDPRTGKKRPRKVDL